MAGSLPTANDVHVDSILTDIAVAYGQDLKNTYIADRAFTQVPVTKQSDKYNVWNKGDFFRSEMALRADGTRSAVSGQRLSQSAYYCDTYALSTTITDKQRANAKGETNLEDAKIRYLMHQALRKRDVQFAAVGFVTGVWTGTTEQTGVSGSPSTNEFKQWNDSSSTPIVDITEVIDAVRITCGKKPNIGIVNEAVFRALKHHADFLDRIKHTQTGVVTADLIAEVLGLEQLLVAQAIQNTANEGATATMADVFGKNMAVIYRAPAATDDDATAGSIFSWSEFDGVTADGAAIRQWYEEPKQATYYEAEQSFDVVLTAADMGGMMLTAVA